MSGENCKGILELLKNIGRAQVLIQIDKALILIAESWQLYQKLNFGLSRK